MTATEFNNRGVSYATIRFFEQALENHSQVNRFSRREDILFDIELVTGKTIAVLLVNEYTLGLAPVLRARSEFPEAEYIVTGANWNAYTREAKEYGNKNAIGIFEVSEFFGAIHRKEPKKYFRKDENGKPNYSFRKA